MTYTVFSEVTVNLSDLVMVLLGLAGVVVLIVLAIVLINLSGTIKKLKTMLDEIALPVSQTVNQIPEVVKKVDKSLTDVNAITESAAVTVPEILDDVTGVATALGTTVETVAYTATNIVDGVDSAVSGVKHGVGHVANNIDVNGLISLAGKITGVLGFVKKMKKGKKKRK